MRALRVGRPVWLAPDRGGGRRHPALVGRREAEVAVVGGWMTGAVVAAVFAEAGHHVALVERDRIARGSTAVSTALLLREPDLGLVAMAERYGAAHARRIWELGSIAVDELVGAVQRLGIDCDLTRADTVYYTLDEEAVGPLRAEVRRRRRLGFPGSWLTAGGLRRRTAIAGRGAILSSENAQLDPVRACAGFVEAAARMGADVYERSPVRRIEPLGRGVRLHTRRGTLDAARVVVATGYATPGFRPLVGRFRMSHTYVLATEPLGEAERREIGLGPVMLWDTERPYHYARWTPDGRLLMGGADRPAGPGRARRPALRTATAALRAYFERILPGLSGVRMERAWEGLFAHTADGLPYIGPHRRYPRHSFALGYGGNGMAYAFLAARFLFDQHRGLATPDHALFAFGRHR